VTDGISDLEFEEMVRVHILSHNEKRDEFNERLPDILADFRDSAIEAIKNGYLPISVDLLESRMGETKVYLADNMEMFDDVCGTYRASTGVIKVVANPDEKRQKEDIYHEMVHTLSGRTLLLKNKIDNEKKNVEHQRIGLSFDVVDTAGAFKEKKFRWINEAVTEEIAIKLSESEDGTYPEERKNLNVLYGNGLLREDLYAAYFENYDPDSADKVPAWKNLTTELSKLHPEINGIEILNNLENEGVEDKLRIEKLISKLNDSKLEKSI
jgi:hypothetical protein